MFRPGQRVVCIWPEGTKHLAPDRIYVVKSYTQDEWNGTWRLAVEGIRAGFSPSRFSATVPIELEVAAVVALKSGLPHV